MQLPQIRLTSQAAKIDLNITKGKQSLQQPKAEMQLEQPKADVRVETRPSKLTIDQTQAWRELGFKTPLAATLENAQLGRQAVLEGTGRAASEGNQLMKIENGGNPIVSQAFQNAYDPMKEFNIGWIPSHGSVKINYQPSDVIIDIRANKPLINIQAQKPIHYYQPGQVDITMQQYSSLNIDFVGVNWKEMRI
ncbi:DUF6470 family protein [Salirhabdus sp. Marseille-P4669]|uniref:DUF6470 family protein n=1 Tax=Salirhabdus sp. Marseille-P4669 TaxID=2042310 RepID=UPI000C7C66E1|nr:DUF6470 family protein [Salirhabdus sp. Marseille-P4669]